MTPVALATQPIRPVARTGVRCDRRPWFEVLLRPACGAAPFDYVVAEYRAGRGVELDLAIVDAAIREMRPHCHYGVNVSLRSLADGRFAARLEQLLSRQGTGIRTEQIVIEVVDREGRCDEWADALSIMLRLRERLGLCFALDDVDESDDPVRIGSLPQGLFSYAKLDTRATADLLAGTLQSRTKAVLRGLLPAAQLVAEGIEDRESWATLSRLSPAVSYWQGFYDGGVPRPLHRTRPGEMFTGRRCSKGIVVDDA